MECAGEGDDLQLNLDELQPLQQRQLVKFVRVLLRGSDGPKAAPLAMQISRLGGSTTLVFTSLEGEEITRIADAPEQLSTTDLQLMLSYTLDVHAAAFTVFVDDKPAAATQRIDRLDRVAVRWLRGASEEPPEPLSLGPPEALLQPAGDALRAPEETMPPRAQAPPAEPAPELLESAAEALPAVPAGSMLSETQDVIGMVLGEKQTHV